MIEKIKRKRDFTYKGVSFNIRSGKYHAQFITPSPEKKHVYIGTYATARLAAEAYNKYVIENKLNRPLNNF